MTLSSEPHGWRTPAMVLIAGALISTIGFGIRAAFGVFLEPMSSFHGWGRETFAFALGVQNLLWGLALPAAGALADRFGPIAVLTIGAGLYTIGVVGMAESQAGFTFAITAGLITGVGVSFTSFSIVMAAMAKAVGPERRGFAMGLAAAAGSFGQVIFAPLNQAFISAYGWYDTLLILAFLVLVIAPLACILPSSRTGVGEADSNQTLGEAIREAGGHRGFILLTAGFFVCGFHVAFVGIHFPSYVQDIGLAPEVGAYALAITGLMNIFGAFAAGVIGARFSKKQCLSVIYALRAALMVALLLAPPTELTIYAFSVGLGLLWLSTVPLTNGIVAQVFGLRYMATLTGFVLLSHQVGAFFGVWLGGVVFDLTGAYDLVWWAAAALGLIAAAVHLPIDEEPLPRLQGQPA